MRIAIVTESFLPQINGVSNTVRHVTEQLTAAGHQALVIAPGRGSTSHAGAPVLRVRSVPLPGYRQFPVGLPDRAVAEGLAAFRPDVVHLASPAVLGAAGLRAARRLGIPTIAVFQTDLAGFARQYHLRADAMLWGWIKRLHSRADRTLAPSSATSERLRAGGVSRVHTWRRGVNLDLFDPGRRDDTFRRRVAPGDEVIVGYVGRLAAEKSVRRLAELADIPGTRLVVIGDGPERQALQRMLPAATFTGMLRGESLAAAFASLDVFVHTGRHETFCQTVQEAQASGVATVAPAAGGPLDLIEHGRTGLLYQPDEVPDLARAVTLAARDGTLRAKLADAGRLRVQEHTWPRVVGELVARHYAAVLPRPLDLAA
ncbi:MAG: glycosyltransferase family 4 protein [Nocardioidaceae bacterium]